MIAYKLFDTRKDGTLRTLFINRSMVVPVGVWLDAECHPTKGFALRPGWHAAQHPRAPHLMRKDGTMAPTRVWCRVEIEEFTEFGRPDIQGGNWFIAKRMRVLEVL